MARKDPDLVNLGADYSYSNNKSGATGKYYFRWDDHADNIKKITGAENREEFRNSPELQENYFKWYSDHKLKSEIDKYKKSGYDGYSDDDLAKVIHFNGATGGRRFLEKRKAPKNTPIEKESDAPDDKNTVDDLYKNDRAAYADKVLKSHKDIDWVKRLYDKHPESIKVGDQPNPATHLMADNGQGYMFPRIQRIDGKLVDLGDRAEDYARETNTGIQLPKEEGTWLARNGYKTAPGVLEGALSDEQRSELLGKPVTAVAPITTADREQWEKMQGAAYQRGIYEDQLDKPEGIALMKEFGIDPARVPAYRADIAQKAQAQREPGALQTVSQGFSSRYLYDDESPRQRYVHFMSQRGNEPTKDFGTDVDAFLLNQEKERAAVEKGWAGFGDPTQDVNYRPPGTKSGFGSSPGMSSDAPPVVVDPRFPTRDPITGRVTPAVIIEE